MPAIKYLQQIARLNNIRGYPKLRKEDLKTLLRNRLPKGAFAKKIERLGGGTTRSLLDDDIPEISQQPLQPTQYVPPPLPKKEGLTQKFRRWGKWLLRFVPEPMKRPINNAFDDFKKKVMSLFPKQ